MYVIPIVLQFKKSLTDIIELDLINHDLIKQNWLEVILEVKKFLGIEMLNMVDINMLLPLLAQTL